MGFDFLSQVAKFLQERKEYRRWLAAFLCLALVVAFGTVAALKLYGQAMTHQEKVLDCQYEVHEHTENCYEENEDGEKILVCGMADYVIHVHNDDCYDARHNLVCPLEEHRLHEHNKDCWEEQKVLICEEEESEGGTEEADDQEAEEKAADNAAEEAANTEDDSLSAEVRAESGDSAETRTELVCGKEEHTHGEDCYAEDKGCDKEEHTHGDGCYEKTLTCEAGEHTHGDGCYTAIEEQVCGKEEHGHDDGCYDEEGNLTCETEEHTHDEGCYTTSEKLMCETEEHTHDDSCYTETLVCETEEHTHDDSCEPTSELICEKTEHVHDENCYQEVEVEKEESEPAPEVSEEEPPKARQQTDHAEDTESTDTKEGHTHTDDCYETEEVLACGELELHTHDADPESGTCCYTPDCFDKDGNLIEGSRPSCGLQQLEEHVHTKECFKIVELTPEEVAALNNGAKLHIHDDGCYDEDGKLICGHDATHIHGPECYDEDGKLVCGYGEAEKKEYRCGKEEHTHGEKCCDEDGNLTCEKEEHTHSPLCFLTEEEREEVERVNQLIAELPSEEEITQKMTEYEEAGEEAEEAFAEYTMALQIQIQEVYGAYLELDEELREYVTGADYLLTLWEMMGTAELDEVSEKLPKSAAFLQVGDNQDSGMVLELLYGDNKKNEEKPEGQQDYTFNTMQGYFNLYPRNITGDITIDDLTVSLYFPAKYINRGEIRVSTFANTEVDYTVSGPTDITRTEDGVEVDYYKYSITFEDYTPAGALGTSFTMKFKTAEVPADYQLKIFGAIESGEKEAVTAENIYLPKYDSPKIVKYVNTNKFDNMKEDGTKVTAQINENGILDDDQYVSFWYRMDNTPIHLRGYQTITLIDYLPEGAVFDQEANPKWMLSEDKKTVSRVFTAESNWSTEETDNKLMLEVVNAELKLKFPNCKFGNADENGIRTAELKNKVQVVCQPIRPSEGEKPGEDTDDITFILTNEPGPKGAFGKGNSANTILDTLSVRESSYMWSLGFTNKASSPLVNIVMEDMGIDSRLKFQRIMFSNIKYGEKELKDCLDHVDAYIYTDSGQESYDTYDLKNSGEYSAYFTNSDDKNANTWTLELNSKKEYKGFKIYFKDDFELRSGEEINVRPFSTFRNPNEKRFDQDNKEANTYKNYAALSYTEKFSGANFNLTAENDFELIGTEENIWIEKGMSPEELLYPSITMDSNGNQIVDYKNSKAYCSMLVKGVLDPKREYSDLRVIDLLPESLEPDKTPVKATGRDRSAVTSTEVCENYRNSGRTAVIFNLDANYVKEKLSRDDKGVYFGFDVRAKITASPGNYVNDAYLLSKDFDELPVGQGTTEDKYEFDGMGTDHVIRHAEGYGRIKAQVKVYAEKFIAKKESQDWTKTGLRFQTGEEFQYKLRIINEAENPLYNIIVYDVLPCTSDISINASKSRESEFTVKLSGPIDRQNGCQVYYTTSPDVYGKDMASVLKDESITWSEVVDDWGTVTAFKFESEEGFELQTQKSMDFIIPVKVAYSPEESKEILYSKSQEVEDKTTGTVVYLEATNSFGYATGNFENAENVESNYVKAQIPFAGFVIQKTDEEKSPLSGAEFKLEKKLEEKEEWVEIQDSKTYDADGKVSFQFLTEGTYRLIETKAPDGYRPLTDPIEITIELDKTTMEYKVTAKYLEEELGGKGTNMNPFVVINETSYKLPETGGSGTTVYTLAGALLTMFGAGFLYKKKFRERRV